MSFERHRDKDGEISRKHGNTHVSTLRAIALMPQYTMTVSINAVDA